MPVPISLVKLLDKNNLTLNECLDNITPDMIEEIYPVICTNMAEAFSATENSPWDEIKHNRFKTYIEYLLDRNKKTPVPQFLLEENKQIAFALIVIIEEAEKTNVDIVNLTAHLLILGLIGRVENIQSGSNFIKIYTNKVLGYTQIFQRIAKIYKINHIHLKTVHYCMP